VKIRLEGIGRLKKKTIRREEVLSQIHLSWQAREEKKAREAMTEKKGQRQGKGKEKERKKIIIIEKHHHQGSAVAIQILGQVPTKGGFFPVIQQGK